MYQKRNNIFEILTLFLGEFRREFYLRQISALAKLPVRTTQNALARLEMERVLFGTTRGKNKYFRLNLENIATKFMLLQAEGYRTNRFLERCPQFKIFLKELKTDTSLILFGSFAKGTMKKASDADLLVIAQAEVPLPFHVLPYRVQAIRLSPEDVLVSLERQQALIKEIAEHHVILNNHSWWINALWEQAVAKKTAMVFPP